MKIGRVTGTVVATVQAPLFDGRALLLCTLLDAGGGETEGYIIAVDTVGAGAGETVLIVDEGGSARQIVGVPAGPIRAVVAGVIDQVDGWPLV
jgi:ethanolamine utilization protein EutN